MLAEAQTQETDTIGVCYGYISLETGDDAGGERAHPSITLQSGPTIPIKAHGRETAALSSNTHSDVGCPTSFTGLCGVGDNIERNDECSEFFLSDET